MNERTKFWMHVVPIFAVGLGVPAWLGANWVGLSSGGVVVAIFLWVQISKYGYGYALKHFWWNPDWKWGKQKHQNAS